MENKIKIDVGTKIKYTWYSGETKDVWSEMLIVITKKDELTITFMIFHKWKNEQMLWKAEQLEETMEKLEFLQNFKILYSDKENCLLY